MIARWWVHTITVETLTGSGAYGDVFAAPVVLAPPNGGWFNDSIHVVRNTTGEQVVAQSSYFTATANAALFTPDSRVTAPSGRQARVIVVNSNDSVGLGLPDHVEVHLT